MATNQNKELNRFDAKEKYEITPSYKTNYGIMYQGDCEEILRKYPVTDYKGKVQLILTSPPFPLNRKKKYGNLTGEEYLNWLKNLAPLFREFLTSDGSIVLEIGNAWEVGRPIMSTLTVKALIAFLEAANLNLCQEFICYNPARLPTPAQWVTVERIRVKDSFTRVWWMAPSERPKANNHNVLTEYSKSMKELLKKGTYNSGHRPSGHHIGEKSFLKDNGGAIPPNLLIPTPSEDSLIEVLPIANTKASDPYQVYCRQNNISPHPARMQPELAEFFIRFLTDKNDLILDPFAGSNTTGSTAEKLERKWCAIELNTCYIETSEVRFKAEPIANAQVNPISNSLPPAF
jgi:site-specific DNA-methyltransferase (cytosine-N4-specific)